MFEYSIIAGIPHFLGELGRSEPEPVFQWSASREKAVPHTLSLGSGLRPNTIDWQLAELPEHGEVRRNNAHNPTQPWHLHGIVLQYRLTVLAYSIVLQYSLTV